MFALIKGAKIENMGGLKHGMLSACEIQDNEMQRRNRAHRQNSMGEVLKTPSNHDISIKNNATRKQNN